MVRPHNERILFVKVSLCSSDLVTQQVLLSRVLWKPGKKFLVIRKFDLSEFHCNKKIYLKNPNIRREFLKPPGSLLAHELDNSNGSEGTSKFKEVLSFYSIFSLKLVHARHQNIPNLQPPALLSLANDVSSFVANVYLDVFIDEFDFSENAVSFASLRDFHVADSVLFELLEEQVNVHRAHRSILISDLFLEETVDELLRNSLNNFVAFLDVVDIVFDLKKT